MVNELTTKRALLAARWLLAFVLVAHFVFDAARPEDSETGAADEPDAQDHALTIVRLKPAELAPGGATVVLLSGIDEQSPHAITATIDNELAEIVYQKGREIVVRLPQFDRGHGKVRVQHLQVRQGDRLSKPRDLWVKQVARRKILYGVIGGLALFILGLRTLRQGLGVYAGGRLKLSIARWTGRAPRGFGVGVLAGSITQSSASSAGVLVDLIHSKLLGFGPALAMLLGSQLGAALTVLVLPIGSAREGLLIVALGVAWMALSVDRRSRAVGTMLVGLGLLFYGVQFLRGGLQPLVSDPVVLPYVRHFTEAGVHGLLASAAAGIVVCALTQGPGPVFALALVLAESSGVIGLREGLAILSGTAFGSAVGAAAIAWPFGREARRMAVGYLALGATLTVAMLLTLPVWITLADVLSPGAPEVLRYGKKILAPHVGMHLAVGFVASQFLLAAIALPLLPLLSRAVKLVWPRAAIGRAEKLTLITEHGMMRLGQVLDNVRGALETTAAMARTMDRARAIEVDSELLKARTTLDNLLVEIADCGAEVDLIRSTTIALSQLHEAIAGLARLAERGIEEGFELDRDDLGAMEALHARVQAAFAALRATADGKQAENLEPARVLEIRINAEERACRQRLSERLSGADRVVVARHMHVTSVLAAYETVGNYLFRAHEALQGNHD